jgi:hypothetical protein
MTCVKCQREIAAERARAAIMLGDGRAALDWQCFESMLKPGRAMELMRLLREATARARAVAEKRAIARGEKLQDEPK